ncbi:hypothetical protein C8J57DRAFT_1338970 [Mycena rebaudengoi]|nr:hypothetical protein C8J57DRAFT_1338970 [Mycena rebaudengoi]
MTALEVQVFIIGYDDSGCKVVLRKKIPPQAQNNLPLLDRWAQQHINSIGYDMKHTQRWACEICGRPARETWFDPRPSLDLQQPRVILYIHHLCEAGGGTCHRAAEKRIRDRASKSGGVPPPPPIYLPKPDGPEIPLAGGCIRCQRDETAAAGFELKRCTGCHLTRYCSTECQKEDWPRHGKICKTIETVEWIRPEVHDTDPTSDMPGAYH